MKRINQGKTHAVRVSCLLSFACGIGLGVAEAETIALYTFEDGAEGEAVAAVVNKVDSSLYGGTAQGVGYEVPAASTPFYTNNIPANCVFSDKACTNVIASMPKAVAFRRNVDGSAQSGGYLEFEGLAESLSQRGAFTIEFFLRVQDGNGEYAKFCMMSDGDRIGFGNAELAAPYLIGASDSNRTGPVDGNWGNSLTKQGWQHCALTYDRATGAARLYYKYAVYGVLDDKCAFDDYAYPNLRFGADIADASGLGRNFCVGDVACIRVSDGVLTTDQFMRMGPGAFFPFKDKAAGEDVTEACNQFAPRDSLAQISGKEGNVKLSDDRPGRYVFASSSRDVLLSDSPNSLYFYPCSFDYAVFGSMLIPDMGGRIAASSQRDSELTIEFFYKKEARNWGSRKLLGFNPGMRWEFQENITSFQAQEQWMEDATRTTWENDGESILDDGLWHHVACVVSRHNDEQDWKRVRIYVDYAPNADDSFGRLYIVHDDYVNNMSWKGKPLSFGCDLNSENAICGKLTCLRIVPTALSPADFMVAVDTLDKPGDVAFRWSFEDGEPEAPLATAVDSTSAGTWACGYLQQLGEMAALAKYVRATPSRRILDGGIERMSSNSAAFGVPSGILQTKSFGGIPYLHPTDWTMEFFVRVDGSARASNVLLAGRGRYNPATAGEWYEWRLALQPDGRLSLSGTDLVEDGATPFAFDNIGPELDGGWHHVAVTYSGSDYDVGVWIDGERRLDEKLSGPMVDSCRGRCQFAKGCGIGGFSGCIDEVRFSARVLERDDLLKSIRRGMALIFR